MSELSEYIYGRGTERVVAELRALPFWWAFNLMVKSPKDLIYVAEKMGFKTLDDVRAWVNFTNAGSIPNQAVWLSLVNPLTTIKSADLSTVTWIHLDDARFAQCKSAADYQRMNSDRDYVITNEATLRKIARECPSFRHQHTGLETSDCDDFVNIARGWLSSVGLGNLAAGKAGTRHFSGADLRYGHAAILCFSRESADAPVVAWWWEPQSGEIFPVSYARLGAPIFVYPDRVELAWCDF